MREAASLFLWQKGEGTRSALTALLESEDPEVSYRAREVLKKIESGLLPDTPEEIALLVQRYHRLGETEGKIRIMGELQQREAYAQMFSLFRSEKNPNARKELRQLIYRVTPVAVRKQLVAGEIEQALRLVELSGEGN